MAKFMPGQSGNPSGRKKGTENKRTQLAKLLEPHASELIEKAVELAKGGDVQALRLCLERLLPKLKDVPIQFDLPEEDLSNFTTIVALQTSVIQAIATGDLTLIEGQRLTDILTKQRQLIEATELAKRVSEVERVLKLRRRQQ